MSNEKKRNDGKSLEQFVAIIETTKLPEGSKVERNDRVYDSDGDQIAELDILISSPFGGSLTYRTLIECRDRPSDGAAPIKWIDELNSRRFRLKVDKIVAVSSSGFSATAQKQAEAYGIETRTMADVTAEAVKSWCPVFAPLMNGLHTVTQAEIMFTDEATLAEIEAHGPDVVIDKENCNLTQTQHYLTDEVLTEKATRTKACFGDLLNMELKKKNYYNGLGHGEKRTERIEIPRDVLSRFTVDVKGKTALMYSLAYVVEFSNERSMMPLVSSKEYKNEQGEVLYKIAHWKGKPGDTVEEMYVILTPKKPEPPKTN